MQNSVCTITRTHTHTCIPAALGGQRPLRAEWASKAEETQKEWITSVNDYTGDTAHPTHMHTLRVPCQCVLRHTVHLQCLYFQPGFNRNGFNRIHLWLQPFTITVQYITMRHEMRGSWGHTVVRGYTGLPYWTSLTLIGLVKLQLSVEKRLINLTCSFCKSMQVLKKHLIMIAPLLARCCLTNILKTVRKRNEATRTLSPARSIHVCHLLNHPDSISVRLKDNAVSPNGQLRFSRVITGSKLEAQQKILSGWAHPAGNRVKPIQSKPCSGSSGGSKRGTRAIKAKSRAYFSPGLVTEGLEEEEWAKIERRTVLLHRRSVGAVHVGSFEINAAQPKIITVSWYCCNNSKMTQNWHRKRKEKNATTESVGISHAIM